LYPLLGFLRSNQKTHLYDSMKHLKFAFFGSLLLLLSALGLNAQTTITAWTFDNLPFATNANPAASTGAGLAMTLGMTNSYNSTNSIGMPDVQAKQGSSVPTGTNCWRIRGQAAAPNGGNGWSSQAPIGTQGGQFSASTLGFYAIHVSCDVNESAQGERNLQIQYTTDGTNWINATNITSGGLATLATNTSSANTVNGVYVKLSSSGTGWNNLIKADLTGVLGADNNTNFAVRIVNASTGADCVNASGVALNNTSGNWSLDNIIISGIAVQPITAWTFENYSNLTVFTGPNIVEVAHPAPTTGNGLATSLGFDTSWTFADSVMSQGSTNFPDVLTQVGSSSGAAGPCCWRVRGQNPTAPPGTNFFTGNGWNSQQDIGTQGAEFDVNTVNYDNIVVTFDLFFTGQAEAKMMAEYTTDGVNWTNASMLTCPSNPSLIVTNDPNNGGSSQTVTGTYMNMTVTGGGWFNRMSLDLTSVPGVTNNPNFGIRIVNAATGSDCTAPNGGAYNNSSGNCRYDNVVVSGRFNGPPAPTIIPDPNATVDGPFTNTFTANPAWQFNITNVTVNGSNLPPSAYNTNVSGQIVFTPSASPLLQTSGSKTIVFKALNYIADSVVQPLFAGVATHVALTAQPSGPSASGGTLIFQPSLAIEDQYGNGTTNPYPNVAITATAGGSGGWTLGGSNVVAAAGGVANFTNLSASVNGSTAVTGAAITFTTSGFGASPYVTNSVAFNIGAPPTPYTPGNLAVIQLDQVQLNSTFNIIEINPSKLNQTTPVNIVPISASNGTNSMRGSKSGSTGRLSLSDDGTLLCFVGFLDGSSLTVDETSFIAYRGVGTLDYTNRFNCPVQYGPVSVAGGTQGRSACTVDDVNYTIADKNGIFQNSVNLVSDNTRVIRSFGGTLYSMSATTPKTVVSYISGSSIIPLVGLPTDGNAMDFYMVQSGTHGAIYDVLYVLDSSSDTITKYTNGDGTFPGTWTSAGTTVNADGADALLATTNGNGGIYLYYTTGSGGSASNSVVRKTDAGGFGAISITDTNTIFTTSATTTLKGISFVPQQNANTVSPTPPPVLNAAVGVVPGAAFTITLSPENAAWRSAITNVTVNGVALTGGYDTTQSGQIVFSAPVPSSPLDSIGSKNIVIGATGYSADAVIQNIGLTQPTLAGTALNGSGKMTFTFSSVSGLTFSVLGTNNITAPLSNWPVLGTATETSPGQYQFVDPTPATNGTQFYILRYP
jgi:hypothetical protein